MHPRERTAARHVNLARMSIAKRQAELTRERPLSQAFDWRLQELDAIQDILLEASGHIDPHRDEPYLEQTPLPF